MKKVLAWSRLIGSSRPNRDLANNDKKFRRIPLGQWNDGRTNISNYPSFWNIIGVYFLLGTNFFLKVNSCVILQAAIGFLQLFLYKKCLTKICKIKKRHHKSTKIIFKWNTKISPMAPYFVKQKLNKWQATCSNLLQISLTLGIVFAFNENTYWYFSASSAACPLELLKIKYQLIYL